MDGSEQRKHVSTEVKHQHVLPAELFSDEVEHRIVQQHAACIQMRSEERRQQHSSVRVAPAYCVPRLDSSAMIFCDWLEHYDVQQHATCANTR
jgi:hypothetical protein